MLGRLHSAATKNSFLLGRVSDRFTAISCTSHNSIQKLFWRSSFVRHCSEKKKNMENKNSAPVVEAPVVRTKFSFFSFLITLKFSEINFSLLF